MDNNSELMVPTLCINNYEEFNNLLVEYVERAIDLYRKKDMTING